ncbi:MAG: aspartate carbamoyltransferase catalytic subunit [Acidimicrobiales bacterium]|nr:aspartate carbamoyltransferase catalytic subunit [Acidimicrobiales bacterium]
MTSHLIDLKDLDNSAIRELLHLTDRFVEVCQRPIPKVPALRGRTIAMVFFEDSTRTRMSFDLAAHRLSADVLEFPTHTSSLSKGETLQDTVETISALGVDALVIRHSSGGLPREIADGVGETIAVINAGDGLNAHPTQGLLDAYTLCQHFNGSAGINASLEGIRIGIVGDIKHSRVARSDVTAYSSLGAKITVVAPASLQPDDIGDWPVEVSDDLDDVLPELDVVGLLRIQNERIDEELVLSLDEYIERFGMTEVRANSMRSEVVITHPGPVNRGIEIADAVLDKRPNVLVLKQVTNGVAVRMAVLFRLLGLGIEID